MLKFQHFSANSNNLQHCVAIATNGQQINQRFIEDTINEWQLPAIKKAICHLA